VSAQPTSWQLHPETGSARWPGCAFLFVHPLDLLPLTLAHLADDMLQHRLHEDQRISGDLADTRGKPAERLQHRTLLLHEASQSLCQRCHVRDHTLPLPGLSQRGFRKALGLTLLGRLQARLQSMGSAALHAMRPLQDAAQGSGRDRNMLPNFGVLPIASMTSVLFCPFCGVTPSGLDAAAESWRGVGAVRLKWPCSASSISQPAQQVLSRAKQ
jgi:hypothetical protein